MTSMPAFVHTLEERLRRDRGEDRWMSRAKCREIQDPELFYVNPQRQPLIATDVVSFYCEECPVRNECLAYALRNGENEGIWGGLTAAERSDLKRGTPRLSIRERVEQRKALP